MNKTLEQTTMRKVAIRLVPFLCVLYIIAFIDRDQCRLRRAVHERRSRPVVRQPSALEPACSSSATSSSRCPAI